MFTLKQKVNVGGDVEQIVGIRVWLVGFSSERIEYLVAFREPYREIIFTEDKLMAVAA